MKIEDIERPTIAEDEVGIRVLASNMCGTDLRTWQRGHPLIAKTPVVIGHEYCGLVQEVGRKVTEFRVGDMVVGSNSCPCMKCTMCGLGSLTLCEAIPNNLIGFSIPGSYAEYMRIPAHIVERNAYLVPKDVTAEEIACSEPLAAAIHALEKARMSINNKVKRKKKVVVAIVGAGAMGLMFLQLLKGTNNDNNDTHVMVMDGMAARLKLAEKLGADQAIEQVMATRHGDSATTSSLKKGVIATTMKMDAPGPDLVVEAAGSKRSWETAFRIVRDGGQVLLFGGCTRGTQVSFDATKLHYREITISGSFHHGPADFKKAIDAIAEGRVRVKEMISSRLPLSQINEAFRMMEAKEALKVCISP